MRPLRQATPGSTSVGGVRGIIGGSTPPRLPRRRRRCTTADRRRASAAAQRPAPPNAEGARSPAPKRPCSRRFTKRSGGSDTAAADSSQMPRHRGVDARSRTTSSVPTRLGERSLELAEVLGTTPAAAAPVPRGGETRPGRMATDLEVRAELWQWCGACGTRGPPRRARPRARRRVPVTSSTGCVTAVRRNDSRGVSGSASISTYSGVIRIAGGDVAVRCAQHARHGGEPAEGSGTDEQQAGFCS
jgi:hypothetical protein